MNVCFILKFLFAIGIFVAAAALFITALRVDWIHRSVRVFYWTRFSFLFGFVLLAVPIVAMWIFPSLLFGLLVLEHVEGWDISWKFTSVTWASFVASLMVVGTFRVTTLNSDARFLERADVAEHAVRRGEAAIDETASPDAPLWSMFRNRWTLVILLGLWIPIWCAFATVGEYRAATAIWNEAPPNAHTEPTAIGAWDATGRLLCGMVLGCLAVTLTLWVINRVQSWIFVDNVARGQLLPFETEARRVHGAASERRAHFLRVFGPGYVDVEGIVRPGHTQLAVLLLFLSIMYLGSYWGVWLRDAVPSDGAPFPAVFFLLLVLTFAGFVMSGLAFFLDFYHIPSLLLVIAVVFTSHGFCYTDHYFELNPSRSNAAAMERTRDPFEGASTIELVSRRDVATTPLMDWQFPAGSEGETMVVVAAAGGGIQAAAWTAQVLTGLDSEFEGFSESIGMASGVSGGSVGLMYYLNGRGHRSNDPRKPMRIAAPERENIRQCAFSSSLEATAWGFAYPDLMRLVFPPAVERRYDRGWALELDWRKQLAGSGQPPNDSRLSDWAKLIASKKMPIVAFNACFADTGKSLVISPLLLHEPSANGDYQEHIQEVYGLFGADPRIATAARLSATFSFVSPICLPLPDDLPGNVCKEHGLRLRHRVADGGYVDNSGLLTAMRWLKTAVEASRSRGLAPPVQNVVFLRIMPFPPDPIVTNEMAQPGRFGICWEIFGPLFALNSAREGSQIARGSWEMELLMRVFRDQKRVQRLKLERDINSHLQSLSSMKHAPEQDAGWTSLLNQSASAVASDHDKWLDEADGLARKDTSPNAQTRMEALNSIRRLFQSSSNINIYSLELHPTYSSDDSGAPLSWKLTPGEKQSIRNAWARISAAIHSKSASALPEAGQPLEPHHLKLFFKHAPK